MMHVFSDSVDIRLPRLPTVPSAYSQKVFETKRPLRLKAPIPILKDGLFHRQHHRLLEPSRDRCIHNISIAAPAQSERTDGAEESNANKSGTAKYQKAFVKSVASLHREYVNLQSERVMKDWMASYDLEKSQFASFVLFIENKLDQIQEMLVSITGRPHRLEAAACCAILWKMPGALSCYESLFHKIASAIQSSVYGSHILSYEKACSMSMKELVQHFFYKPTYFEQLRELETRMDQHKDLESPQAVGDLTPRELESIVKFTKLEDLVAALMPKLSNTRYDHFISLLKTKRSTNSAAISKQDSALGCADAVNVSEQSEEHEESDDTLFDHVEFSASSSLIQLFETHANSFSQSVKEILFQLLIETFDSDCYPVILSQLESQFCKLHMQRLGVFDQVQELSVIVNMHAHRQENAFLLYLAICYNHSGTAQFDKEMWKQRFFEKLLSMDIQMFFIKDLATFISAEQWNMLLIEMAARGAYNSSSVKYRQRSTPEMQAQSEKAEIIEGETEEASDFDSDEDSASAVGSIQTFNQLQEFVRLFIHGREVHSARLVKMMTTVLLPAVHDTGTLRVLIDACQCRLEVPNAVAVLETKEFTEEMHLTESDANIVDENALKRLESVFADLSLSEQAEWIANHHEQLRARNGAVEDTNRTLRPTVTKRSSSRVKKKWIKIIWKYIYSHEDSDASPQSLMQSLILPRWEDKAEDDATSAVSRILAPLEQAERLVVFAKLQAQYNIHSAEDAPVPAGTPGRLVQSQTRLSNESDGLDAVFAERLALPLRESQPIRSLQNLLPPNALGTSDVIESAILSSSTKVSESQKDKSSNETEDTKIPSASTAAVVIRTTNVSTQTELERRDSYVSNASLTNTARSDEINAIPTGELSIQSLLSTSSKKKRMQKINASCVPRAVAGLITSWRMNIEQLIQFSKKSISSVLRIIADAYSECIYITRRKQGATSTQSKKMSLTKTVYQLFLHSYGLPGIADMHLLALTISVEMYRRQHLRVEYFARFFFQEVLVSEYTRYIEFLECLVYGDIYSLSSQSSASDANNMQLRQTTYRLQIPDKEIWTLSLEKAQEAAEICLRSMKKQCVQAFYDKIAALHVKGIGGDSGVNVDSLLQIVLQEWREEQIRIDNFLRDAFRAGDVNNDGQLTSAEFTQIVLSIDRRRDLGDILLMYSDSIRRTSCKAVGSEVFLQVAREYDLDKVPWDEDTELYNTTNNIENLDATWILGGVRNFFLGTLESLIRDLDRGHFLRKCEGAGCGCIGCIVDGYIGFQKMRFDARRNGTLDVSHEGSVSEVLLWTRFWHLMRQLYEASSASDGVKTLYEGSAAIRSDIAPVMAIRHSAFRRNALPNTLFPDTARIIGKISDVHGSDLEVFDAESIRAQFRAF